MRESDKDYMLILLLLVATGLIIFGLLLDHYDLYKFRKCYDVNFSGKECRKYINY